MSSSTRTVDAFKRTPVIVAVAIALIVVLVWLLAFFLPQGHKLSTLNSKQQALQQQVNTGNAKVARLKRTLQHTSQLQALNAKIAAYVPSTPDIFKTTANYTSMLSAAVASAQMTLTSVAPGGVRGAASGTKFSSIPVTLVVTGTYDHLLSLIAGIYTLPRLTHIIKVDITGGGPGTNRSTALKATISLMTFTTATPPTSQ